jgi:hypothetical protein
MSLSIKSMVFKTFEFERSIAVSLILVIFPVNFFHLYEHYFDNLILYLNVSF